MRVVDLILPVLMGVTLLFLAIVLGIELGTPDDLVSTEHVAASQSR